jgi:hypothetical protein
MSDPDPDPACYIYPDPRNCVVRFVLYDTHTSTKRPWFTYIIYSVRPFFLLLLFLLFESPFTAVSTVSRGQPLSILSG